MTTTDLALQNALTPDLPGDFHVVMILDRSGSMADLHADMVGGFNSFIRTCRERGIPRCDVQYARFDNRIEPCVFRLPLGDVPEMKAAMCAPRGSTALLDAVGQTVSPIATNPDDRYVVIIFTDGYENASREWTKEKVRALVREREDLGNWSFGFFGADIDAWADGEAMGFAPGSRHSHSRADYSAVMASSAKMAAIMSQKRMRFSKNLARAAGADSAHELSDDEAERILREDEDAAKATPTA